MADFVTALFTFPTAVFSILLGVVTVYWLFVIAGALDLDALEGLHGAGHAADAAHAHHALDGDTTALDALGLRGVPLTVWLSGFVLFAWALTLVGMSVAGPALAAVVGNAAAGALVAVVAMIAAAAITAVAVRPLRRFTAANGAVANRSLVGKVCTVTTMRVDEGFGQAEVADGGAGLLVQVRCSEANALTRGSEALIFEYDADACVFHVSRFDDESDARAVERRLRSQ